MIVCKATRQNILNLKEKNLIILGTGVHRLNVAAEDESMQTVDDGDVIIRLLRAQWGLAVSRQ